LTAVVLAKTEDATQFAAVHAAAFSAQEAWSEKSFADLLILPSTLALMIEQNGQADAILLVQKTPDTAEILTIAVDPAAQRRGRARQLIFAAAQLLGQSGQEKILLDVAADNKGALALYQALGFKQDGRRRAYYRRAGVGAVDAVLMSRPVAGQIGRDKA